MVEIKLQDGQDGYDEVGDYVRKFWSHHACEDVVVSLSTSYDGNSYYHTNEIASPAMWDVEFLNDWWEGEKFIKLFGIRAVSDLDITGGVYMKE